MQRLGETGEEVAVGGHDVGAGPHLGDQLAVLADLAVSQRARRSARSAGRGGEAAPPGRRAMSAASRPRRTRGAQPAPPDRRRRRPRPGHAPTAPRGTGSTHANVSPESAAIHSPSISIPNSRSTSSAARSVGVVTRPIVAGLRYAPMSYTVVCLGGDGIGPEVMREAIRALELCRSRSRSRSSPFGGPGIRECGEPLPPATLAACLAADAVLLAAVGSPEYERAAVRPEQGLLHIRSGARRVREPPARARGRCRRDDRAGAFGRALLRPQGSARLTGWRSTSASTTRGRSSGSRGARSSLRAAGAGSGDGRRQAWGARDLEAVARGRGRGRDRLPGRAGSTRCSSTTRRCSSSATRVASTSCSPRTPSATSSRTWPRWPRAASGWRRRRVSSESGPGHLRADPRLRAGHRRAGIANPAAMLRSAVLMLEHGLGRPDEARLLDEAVDEALRVYPDGRPWRHRDDGGVRRRASSALLAAHTSAGG